MYTVFLLAAIFGLYFCFFAKDKLPKYYDENKISAVQDAPFRMNVPGLYFNAIALFVPCVFYFLPQILTVMEKILFYHFIIFFNAKQCNASLR